ncbi:DNA glycosylase AlkZ-like family protein [Nocardioides euryhalodurans]|uniref:Winged helix-turn-helix domain-containing protein n=1 Tax=Nocardioides euryhalodurans TaxID=2518370 RepID=A0A4P7GM85_9ACTN|nr:crosslink repair DNA glycosylase YcaQ family protein [Nocardioides euryhalodurans]QBR92974.1 winged helix-turn-helix domain-containing protein [Nocardioides euryhalodurans]
MAPHELTQQDARRIAVRAQLLDAERPTGFEEVLHHLTLLQDDPCAAVVPSAHLVLWSRLGSSYDRATLDEAVESGRVVELHQMLRPAADIALHRAGMANWPAVFDDYRDIHDALAGWLAANDDTRRDILEKLYDEGPVTSRALPDTTLVPWRSSGWNDDRNVRMLLENMVGRGEVAVAGRQGRDKLWDLAERVYPDDPVPDLEDARRELARRRLAGLGIARPKAAVVPGEPTSVGEAGEEAVVEGVRGRWRVDPAYLEDLAGFGGRVALLSPLDRLIIDRKRMVELFAFDYQLEMFKPAAKRRFGYWAMPVLVGDRLVGKVDATAERERGVLRVDAVHEDEPWGADVRAAVDAQVEDLARWLDLEVERS